MKKLIIIAIIAVAGAFVPHHANAQGKYAIKANLLYGAAAQAPNIGAEFGIAPKSTIEATFAINPWKNAAKFNNDPKLVHWLARVEYRYWLCERFNGHFIGGHLFGGSFNISQKKFPPFTPENADVFRYEGRAAGIGFAYGYAWMLSKNWNVEANIGLGYANIQYEKYHCVQCGKATQPKATKHYFGPTAIGVSLVYIIK